VNQRYLCIHGHFYQPPRENPWLEAVEIQDSAYPYHDWNERITAECYAPNAAARILDGEQRIIDIVNNYANLSFNFGPTLHSWLKSQTPRLDQAIIEADQQSRERFGGHGPAIAQAYNHMILPLANARDKATQILWGRRDFQHRFGREAEGMWLPEAAVDTETLEALAEQGIRFTILSPFSAKAVRPLGNGEWMEVSGGKIDPTMPYLYQLPSGRKMALFFYDGPISRGIAFEDTLANGDNFARRLESAFSDSREQPQLVHIATDGETYGHHKAYGDMALAYAVRKFETDKLAEITVYGQFLEKFPPTQEVQIFDGSSWSCAHGIGRWYTDCGCNTGGHPGWNQKWREPLRNTLDWLRDSCAPRFESAAGELLSDPWKARDDYISVILDRSRNNLERFFQRHAKRALADEEKIAALELLELQRHAMLMYTSCGWFFDELSGVEAVQVIQYAGRVVQLAEKRLGQGLEKEFLSRLSAAKSNVPENGDGRTVFEKFVRPVELDLLKVAAHYGISSLFEPYGPDSQIYCYAVHQDDHQCLVRGRTSVSLGHVRITSQITGDNAAVTFGFASLGDHHIAGGVRKFANEQSYQSTVQQVRKQFEGGEFTGLVHAMDAEFGSHTYTLKLLFRDEQRKILNLIFESALAEVEAAYRQIYENRAPLIRFVAELGMPQIRRFQVAAEFTLNADLERAIEQETWDADRIRGLLEEAQKVGVPLDVATLEFALRRRLEAIAEGWRKQPCDLERLQLLESSVRLARSFPFEVRLWEIQNAYYSVVHTMKDAHGKCSHSADETNAWHSSSRALGELLSMHLE
jgi:alpha-amylase/alpha-mannosidase (GH57 family)